MLFSKRETDINAIIKHLKHYLPTQAPLKDFIHHNTLHAFQKDEFFHGLEKAHTLFGYKVLLSIEEYRNLYSSGSIKDAVLNRVITENSDNDFVEWEEKMLSKSYNDMADARIGKVRNYWKTVYKIDLDSLVHPLLFRIIGSFLDQGISIWAFPNNSTSFLEALKELESVSAVSFFRTKRARQILLDGDYSMEKLLKIIVGDSSIYEHYLFDQQFAHPGWSGMIAQIEEHSHCLIDKRTITLEQFITFELLLEIDALDDHFGSIWSPLGLKLDSASLDLFSTFTTLESFKVRCMWQKAYEWSYYDEVIRGIQLNESDDKNSSPSFQAIFCIDDRECSFRRYIEQQDPQAETFGTAGFFNVEFYFQPENSQFYTKVCPAPLTPNILIRELENKEKLEKEYHFGKHTHGLISGWILTHTIGFWSALKLIFTIFKPTQSAASVSSFSHMDKDSSLTIENIEGEKNDEGLQIGFTVPEMVDRLEGLLKSIGLTSNFAENVYVVGHGSSSVNNTHYAGYDCGACSGRPGSVNARVISFIANHSEVRKLLEQRGIVIPETTRFIGALHDTARDEIMFYDLKKLGQNNYERHLSIAEKFQVALQYNAKERSRRFMLINSRRSLKRIHRLVQRRTVSLFEPRPELNHATNTLAIVGRRNFTQHLFLDRRAFMNSYDYRLDPEGKLLLNILNAVAPVCGGINLEYFFSRVDNQNLGAGTKLPHNVISLIGVANGIDGDLRTGLPSQMIEVHDPLRLLVIVEHYPKIVLNTIQQNPSTYEWFKNAWVLLVAINPQSKEAFLFENGEFKPYFPLKEDLPKVDNLAALVETSADNLPVCLIQN